MASPIRGADVSMTAEIESLGAQFHSGGRKRELFWLLYESGVNTVRLRLWVDPHDERGEAYLGGTNDLDNTVQLARRAKAAGHRILLDLHYSDFWTDPKKQRAPKAWRDLRGLDFDIIGLSYYPFWHGTLDDLGANLNDIAERYGKDVLVVETSYAWTDAEPEGHRSVFRSEFAETGGYPATLEGQSAFLRDQYAVVAAVPGSRGLGIVYWEPAWLPVDGTTWASRAGMEYGDDVAEGGNPWANQAVFDFEGNALPSLRVLGQTDGPG
ncbi:glycosyl hydrolase 53 family protein [Glycomyces buryatensis]|uniref:Arabinogalactan endo-beta-1,4-galactanase n=1 Tax=Glycomyces buryatensis TaxID=2570927 RepID=A0A4S8PR35_9ACTN|nr:glycosyl hydrolase 53 family protein [Glycomyces buryatensis]THV33637.1 hypothetical protein FAB82_26240 [Glycomyces buryatensis]